MNFKHKETGDLYVTDNTNLFSMLEREGYELETVEPEDEKEQSEGEEPEKIEEEVKKEGDERAKLIAKAKELGIKSPHMMKTETLIEKIAELEKE